MTPLPSLQLALLLPKTHNLNQRRGTAPWTNTHARVHVVLLCSKTNLSCRTDKTKSWESVAPIYIAFPIAFSHLFLNLYVKVKVDCRPLNITSCHSPPKKTGSVKQQMYELFFPSYKTWKIIVTNDTVEILWLGWILAILTACISAQLHENL